MLRSFTREYVFLAFCSHFYKQELVPLFSEQVHIDVHLFAEALSCKKQLRVTFYDYYVSINTLYSVSI